MKTSFYMDGKKTTRKAMKELLGEDRMMNLIGQARETFIEDPLIENDFYIGEGKILTIRFS